jgi:hypothetical protein
MPTLLNFIQNNGTISGNHHTPLISHTATDILTAQTGVYGDRMGIPVSNSYGFFRPDGSVGFNSSFLYWTALSGDGKPQMLNELGKTAPAPWVPFTRAGCDVGGFSVANIEFESVPADVNTVFGATRRKASKPTMRAARQGQCRFSASPFIARRTARSATTTMARTICWPTSRVGMSATRRCSAYPGNR